MYAPQHFVPADGEVAAFLRSAAVGDLVTTTAEGLRATTLPILFNPVDAGPEGGPGGSIVGHLARANPQWQSPALGEALLIVHGPDGYVTPAWYAAKREHGRVVPTWDYMLAHVRGELVVHDDPAWVGDVVRRLTARFERDRPQPWSVDDAPAVYVEGMLRAIVGVELRISRIEASFKLSQNRSAADIAGVVAGFEAAGRPDLARLVGRTRG